MKGRILAWLAAAVFGVTLMGLTPAEVDQMIKQADQLTSDGKYAEVQKILMDVNKADPNNNDAYWMTARNYFYLGELTPSSKEKLDDYTQCETWAKKLIAKDPKVPEGYFWAGTGVSQESVMRGIAKSLGNAKPIEDYFLKALAMHPTYKSDTDSTEGGADLALCEFYRKVPDSVLMSMIYKTRGNLDKSVSYCQAALKIIPERIDYNKELGVALTCRGQKKGSQQDIDAGKKYLEKVGKIPARTDLDRFDQADAQKILANPKMACGYARARQEEVTEVK
jgi:hypothetical protein